MSSIRETAEKIVRETILVVPGKIADRYIAAIEQALRDERERCAKIADAVAKKAGTEWRAAYKRNDSSPMKVYNGRRLAAEEIAGEIRKED